MSRTQLLIVLGAATVAFSIVLMVLDRMMQDAGGPSILGFEYGGSEARAAAITAE